MERWPNPSWEEHSAGTAAATARNGFHEGIARLSLHMV